MSDCTTEELAEEAEREAERAEVLKLLTLVEGERQRSCDVISRNAGGKGNAGGGVVVRESEVESCLSNIREVG